MSDVVGKIVDMPYRELGSIPLRKEEPPAMRGEPIPSSSYKGRKLILLRQISDSLKALVEIAAELRDEQKARRPMKKTPCGRRK